MGGHLTSVLFQPFLRGDIFEYSRRGVTWHPYCFNHFFHCLAGIYPNSRESVALVLLMLVVLVVVIVLVVVGVRRGVYCDATMSMACTSPCLFTRRCVGWWVQVDGINRG